MIVFQKRKDPDNRYEVSDVEFRIETSDITIDDIIEEFKCFLMGCGYPPSLVSKIALGEDSDHEDSFPNLGDSEVP